MIKIITVKTWKILVEEIAAMQREIRKLRVDTFGFCRRCSIPASYRASNGKSFCSKNCEANWVLRSHELGREPTPMVPLPPDEPAARLKNL